MKKTDFFWMSRDDWWGFKNGDYYLTEKAPEEARISFDHFLKQIEDGDGDDLD